jgi:hypothetical protein
MSTRAYLRLTIAGLLLAGLGSASACGSSESDDKGGSGGMDASTVGPIQCGSQTCDPFIVPIPGAPAVEACCVGDDGCGLDSTILETFGPTFEERCQPRDQPGVRDSACPNSTSTSIDGGLALEFDGCCRTDVGRCGYMLDKLFDTYEIGLGCVDSAPFLDGGTPEACGDGSGSGGAGNSGAGGASSASAGAGGS